MHSLLNNIVLLGALQGVIISTMLFLSRKNHRYANKLLGWFILLISMACFNLYVIESSLYGDYEDLHWVLELIPFVVVMPLGPLLYFYTLAVMDPEFRISKKQRFHFATVILDFVPAGIVWFFLIGILSGLLSRQSGHGWGDVIDEWNAWSDIPRWISLAIYLFLAKRELTKSLAKSNAGSEKPDFQWLLLFINSLFVFLGIWLLFLIPYIIPSVRYHWLDAVTWYPLYIPLTIIVYWAGIRGYIQSQIASVHKISPASFSPEIVQKTITALQTAMTESKLFLDPGLNATQLSSHLKIPQKTISGVLNQHLNKSFNEFLNEYRVEEVKRKLTSSAFGHLTITGIAFECGFNSQATFQRAFKSIVRQSPSEFLERHRRFSEKISA